MVVVVVKEEEVVVVVVCARGCWFILCVWGGCRVDGPARARAGGVPGNAGRHVQPPRDVEGM